MSEAPIFIHSLFRTGSTYIFKVFRRSWGYWCYQESMHESVIFANNDPNQLLAKRGDELVDQLRHPLQDAAYFKELHETWPVWKDCLDQAAIYDAYFVPKNIDIGIAYFKVLADAAKGRPVFQECRTSGRIGALRDQIGGTHIYLWRNPWDQWWSYKVARYFDVANLLFINASEVPSPIENLRHALGIAKRDVSNVAEAFEFFWHKHLSSRDSYQVFYMLWCLGLREGLTHAELLLSIDRLSDSSAYRTEMRDAFLHAGMPGIDFSDCRVPQGRYLEQDQDFFGPLEKRVHQLLLEGGWSQAELNQILAIRQQYEPLNWREPIKKLKPTVLAEQATRARGLTRRFETNLAQVEARVMQAEEMANLAEGRAQQEVACAERAEERAQLDLSRAEAQAKEALERLHTLAQDLRDVHLANHHHWLLAEQRGKEVDTLRASLSWKVTAPLRFLAKPLFEWKQKWWVKEGLDLKNAQGRLISFAFRTWVRIEKYKRLRLFMLRTLSHIPALDLKLRRMYEQHMIALQFPASYGQEICDAKSSQFIVFKPLSSGMHADQRTPLEASFTDYSGPQ